MTRRGSESIKVLVNHWRWLERQRLQEGSGKLQATSRKLDKTTLQ
jgi:hypothetical protein